MGREKAEKQDATRSLEVSFIPAEPDAQAEERVVLLTVSFSMLKPCVEEVEISRLAFLIFGTWLLCPLPFKAVVGMESCAI